MNAEFFTGNRQRLSEHIDTKLAIIAGNTSVQRSNDTSFAFEQDANFWYLCGIDAPDWLLIVNGEESILVAPEVDEIHQVFDGSLSFDKAKLISGVEKVVSFSEGKILLEKLAQKHTRVATLGPDPRAKYYDFSLNPAPVSLRRKLKKLFTNVEDCRLALARLRAIKQPEEVAAIRRAVELTTDAFELCKSRIQEYRYEYEVEAEFTYHFRKNGAKGHAYDPIVASGKNACTLHYVQNDSPLNAEDIILLDIGARVNGYAADISRTYALGAASQRQRDVHRAVELAHQEITSLLKPGLKVKEYADEVDEIMKNKLEHLGLLKSPEDYRKYFPHAISHGLGIDVHDSLGQPEEFLEGMVLTVEPGIYIPEEGIGVRIEDDILITKTGHENLSAALPTSL